MDKKPQAPQPESESESMGVAVGPFTREEDGHPLAIEAIAGPAHRIGDHGYPAYAPHLLLRRIEELEKKVARLEAINCGGTEA